MFFKLNLLLKRLLHSQPKNRMPNLNIDLIWPIPSPPPPVPIYFNIPMVIYLVYI